MGIEPMSTRRKGAVLTPTLKDPWNHKELNLGFPIANGACYHCTMVPLRKLDSNQPLRLPRSTVLPINYFSSNTSKESNLL